MRHRQSWRHAARAGAACHLGDPVGAAGRAEPHQRHDREPPGLGDLAPARLGRADRGIRPRERRWIGRGPEELTHIFDYAPKVDGHNVVLIGIRDVDVRERQIIRESGVTAFTMRDIDERGLGPVLREAIQHANDGTVGFHLSLDMDAVDPDEAPGVGTPVRGGMTYREAHLAMETLCDCAGMVSMEVVEVNPVLDEANQTALLAVELVTSAMGKKIL